MLVPYLSYKGQPHSQDVHHVKPYHSRNSRPCPWCVAGPCSGSGSAFETSTIWSEGTHTFQGVSLKVLADRLGIDGATLRATAINDYSVDIPLTDAVEGGPIVAYKMDDATMSVRDKGPLWIVYPYDSDAAYRSEVIYSRSIWQLDRIEALD